MTSVERVGAYGDIDMEAPPTTEGDLGQWPNEGVVEFDDVEMRYVLNASS